MNMLAKHIKTLLLEHKQVVLPRFGTFYTEREGARCEGDGIFVPEGWRLCFTPLTCIEDDLLVESFVRTYGISRDEAQRRLDAEVANCGKTLASVGVLDFDTLGTFVFAGGRIEFHACKAGLAVPRFYGLDAFQFEPLPRLASENDNADKSKKESYTIRVNRKLVHYAAAVVASIVICFVFNTSLGNSERREAQGYAMTGAYLPGLGQPSGSEDLSHEDIEAEDDEQVGSDEILTDDLVEGTETTDTEGAIDTETEEQIAERSEQWTIVLASDVPRRNAEQYVDMLTGEGYENVRLHETGRMLRVVYGAFDTHDEANVVARQLRTSDERFATAWLMQIQ